MTREQIEDTYKSNKGKKGKHQYRVILAQLREKRNEAKIVSECSRVVNADNKQIAIAFARDIIKLEFGVKVRDFYVKCVYKLSKHKAR